jgi:hypothetical protein
MSGDLDRVLRGRTLKVYWFILRAGRPVRVTEVQHGLGISTASLVQYHINKLEDAGLVAEEQAGFVVRRVEVKHFLMLRGMIIPFQVAYVCFFTTTLVAMLAIIATAGLVPLTSFGFLAVSVNIAALLVSSYETVRSLRTLP